MTTQHLTVEQFIALKHSELAEPERSALLAHIAVCAECRARADDSEPTTQVADRTEKQGVPRRPAKEDHLERGTSVGRYIVLDIVGSGGMGVVYAAFDPELDRKVAVKLLQAAKANNELSGGQAWLQREAQAMARVSHPNVIAVHDVGTLPGDRIFIAMELIEGMTLRAWLKADRRPWREVVRVFSAAGAGLVAAHAAGLVHRDFKPDNVLLGNDGRVKVMDFGLARAQRDPDNATGAEARLAAALSPLSADLTEAGAVLGTPAYIPPEVYSRDADARSDQFSFGVALYEALYGGRPWDKDQLVSAALARTQLSPRPPPSDTDVPARLQRLVARALSMKPEDRFVSMEALLAELAADPTVIRTRIALGAVAVALVVGAGAAVLNATHQQSQLCKGAERHLVGVWDDARKAAVSEAFRKTGKPYASEALAGVVRGLDAYGAELTSMSTASCEATRLRGEQSDAVFTLRQSCIEDRLAELDALAGLLAAADAPLVEKADKAVAALAPLRRCADVAALQAPDQPPTDTATAAKVAEHRKKLAEARAALDAGRFDAAVAAATAAAEIADAIPFASGASDALFVRGQALAQSAKIADAATVLGDAAFSGYRGHRDDVVADAASSAAQASSDGLGRDAEARLWLGLAGAAAARVPQNRIAALHVQEATGIVAGARGDFAAAADAHTAALDLAKQLYAASPSLLWRSEQLLAASLAKAGRYADAVPHFQAALALRESTVGPNHPDMALLLTNLGGSLLHTPKLDEARRALERALAIRELNFGPDSPKLVATLNNLAELLNDTAPDAAARAHAIDVARRGVAIASKVPGPAHPLTHTAETTLGEILSSSGDRAGARTLLDDVLAREEKTKSPVLPTTLTARAAVDLAERRWAEAAAFDERAIALFEAQAGKDGVDLWEPLAGLGEAKLALGQTQSAVAALGRAVTLGEKGHVSDRELAPVRALLVRAGPPAPR